MGDSGVRNTADSTIVDQSETNARLDGMRAAMYGEMVAAVSGLRPWCEREREWDVALEGAIRFIEAAGFDDRTSRLLLDEAAATRNAGDLHGWDASVDELCERLAAEFRRRVRNR